MGEWLPEPVATSRGPEETAELADSLTLGFLVLLDRLAPTERAVFLLADVFGESFASIAASVGKSEAACRQIASRARRKVHDERSAAPTTDEDPELLTRLVGAVLSGDAEQLLDLLDADVVLVSDGGPSRHAARRPVVGPDRVARLLMNIARRTAGGPAAVVEVNGRPSLVLEPDEGRFVTQIDQRDGKVVAIWVVLNPTKLHGLDGVTSLR